MADDHADDGGETVDAVEVEQVGEERVEPGDDGRGEQDEERGEVDTGQEDAGDRARHFREIVG